VVEEGGDVGGGAGVGEVHGGGDCLVCLGVDLRRGVLVEDSAGHEVVAEGGQRVFPAQPFGVFGGAVPGGVDHRVAAQPVADRLQQRGLVLASGPVQGGAGGVADGEDVVAVDPLPGHPVGAAALPQFRLGGRRLDRGAHAELVVDDHVHDRQVPQHGQVQRLVERADVGGGVTEQAHHRGRVRCWTAAVGDRERGAGRQRDLAADDAVPAHEADLGVEQVHRPSPSPGQSGFAPEQLGHHAARVGAAG